MKLSQLTLVAALAAVWAALPPAIRAQDDDRDGGERIEKVERIERVNRPERNEQGEDRRGRGREGREGMGRREGPEGRGTGPGTDPVMNEKFEKVRGLEQKVREMSRGMREGSDAEKAAAKTEARKVLGELFDAKVALDSAMLEKMEKHVSELRAKIAKKKSSREKAIDSRLARMTGEGDDWD